MSDIELVGERTRLDDTQGLGSTEPVSEDNKAVGKAALDWVEARTGAGTAVVTVFNPLVPRVARWRYALGAALVSCLIVEVVTGLLLMCTYSPSVATAWGGTFYIDRMLTCGWFLRGLHYFAAHAMIVTASLHLVTVMIAGVYRAPREMNWWLGLGLMGLIVGFTMTGNALVWDQDGYWAWNVETSIAGGAPVFGPIIQRLVVGGSELGSLTLGRLYALHVGILPLLVVAMVVGHIVLARRHSLIRPGGATGALEPAWPKQVFFNMMTSAVVLGVVAAVVLYYKGAPLDAPADPASRYPARPAWFFLWLFELRKHFMGPREIIATMVIPGALASVMILLPFLDRVFPRKLAHFLACGFGFTVLGTAGYLTALSFQSDAADPHYREDVAAADVARDRAVTLAMLGIPPEGASALLGHDPLFHGRAMLNAKCLGCHAFGDQGLETQSAPDLKDFGSRAWVRGLLDNPQSAAYYGKVPVCDGMAEWKRTSKLTAKQLDDVADFVATFAKVAPDETPEEWLNTPGISDHPGVAPFQKECIACHVIEGLGGEKDGTTRDAPNLFGWGSPRWISKMIRKPSAPDHYGYLEVKDRMPAFQDQLTDNDVQAIVRYLRNDYPGAPLNNATPVKPPSSNLTAKP